MRYRVNICIDERMNERTAQLIQHSRMWRRPQMYFWMFSAYPKKASLKWRQQFWIQFTTSANIRIGG